VVNGHGISIAIDNKSLMKAFMKLNGNNTVPLECWARPHHGEMNPNTEVDEGL
jgi:hypothetical protein